MNTKKIDKAAYKLVEEILTDTIGRGKINSASIELLADVFLDLKKRVKILEKRRK